MKKLVIAVVVIFLGFWMFTDPNGLADSAQSAGGQTWEWTQQRSERSSTSSARSASTPMGLIASLSDPNIGKHLLREEGEVIVDEVRHHWAAYWLSAIEAVAALFLLIATPFVNVNVAWIFLFAVFGLLLHALWGTLREHRDRFVITNMRVSGSTECCRPTWPPCPSSGSSTSA